VGLRNLSKMAMIKNMEMRMAVATNPNDTALTELSKCLKGSSLCTLSKGAPIGAHAYPSFSTIFLSCCFPFPSSQLRNLAGLHHVYVVLLGHSNAVSERQRERERERELWTVLKAVAVLKGFTPLPKPLPLSEYLKLVA
jgi:hypothetical protein